MVEIVTIEKSELVRLIDLSVSDALERSKLPSRLPEIMTKADVAKYLKKSHSTITRWMRRHGLPYHGAGRPTFKRSEVDAWLAQT